MRMRIFIIFSLIFTAGCSSFPVYQRHFEDKDELLAYLNEGYDETIPDLYYDEWKTKRSRLKTLLKGLGYGDYTTSFRTIDKGETLSFTNWTFSFDPNDWGILGLTSDSPPRSLRKDVNVKKRITTKRSEKGRQLRCYTDGGHVTCQLCRPFLIHFIHFLIDHRADIAQ
jgi:hypothetical protein